MYSILRFWMIWKLNKSKQCQNYIRSYLKFDMTKDWRIIFIKNLCQLSYLVYLWLTFMSTRCIFFIEKSIIILGDLAELTWSIRQTSISFKFANHNFDEQLQWLKLKQNINNSKFIITRLTLKKNVKNLKDWT